MSAPNASFDIERIFRNISGGDITINEIGVYVIADYYAYNYCIIRDKLAQGVMVSNGEFLKVKYTIKITA